MGRTQCHFFAGIGVWSHALRLAGWPDDREVWTGSCPCQPFSAAGRGSGFDDERHLWPTWFALIRECRPATIFGEQVASPDGLKWLDLVHADMEGAGYAVGAADLCAAGVGAPHIRQRIYFVAHANSSNLGQRLHVSERESRREVPDPDRLGQTGELGNAGSEGSRWDTGAVSRAEEASAVEGRGARRVADEPVDAGADRELANPVFAGRSEGRTRSGRRSIAGRGVDSGMAHTNELDQVNRRQPRGGRLMQPAAHATVGFWSDCEWLPCSDGVSRPVEPGTFPLAHGATARVGRLRAYGNAIVPQVAAAFIRAAMGALPLDIPPG